MMVWSFATIPGDEVLNIVSRTFWYLVWNRYRTNNLEANSYAVGFAVR